MIHSRPNPNDSNYWDHWVDGFFLFAGIPVQTFDYTWGDEEWYLSAESMSTGEAIKIQMRQDILRTMKRLSDMEVLAWASRAF